jgi:hypothetical protein
MNNHDNMSPFMVAMVGFFIDDKPQEQEIEIDVEGLM